MQRQNVSSGTSWESDVGYSRAVRVGNQVFVSGTTATDESGDVVGIDDPYEQTVQTLRNVEWALNEAGADLDDVVKTRIYVKDVAEEEWVEEVGKAHSEFFDEVRPASLMLEVKRLVHPEMLVEIEAEAVIAEIE